MVLQQTVQTLRNTDNKLRFEQSPQQNESNCKKTTEKNLMFTTFNSRRIITLKKENTTQYDDFFKVKTNQQ